MLAISFRFISGRYHAAPWNKQVNEGGVEWPPSPWRLLRALIASWYQKGRDDVTAEALIALLDKLSAPPKYLLPPATIAHARHYMPIGKIKNGQENTTRILDTFLALQTKPLAVCWDDLELSAEERRALELLLGGIYYFGRAESWVEARIMADAELDKIRGDKTYSESQVMAEFPKDGDCEPVKLLSCMNSEEYDAWKAKNARQFSKSLLPQTTFDALQAQTSDLKKAGWDKPPGSKWVFYARKKGVLNVLPEPAAKKSSCLPTVARFAVASAVRPRLKHSLSLAERIHKTLVKLSGGEQVFTGCDENGNPLENAGHARIFCESAEREPALGRTIGCVTVYAPGGFGENAEGALRRLQKVWGYGGHDVRLMLLGLGDAASFKDVQLLAKSRQWKSITPFVPTRHPKATRAGEPKLDPENGLQIGSPKHDLLRLLKLGGYLPSTADCENLGLADRALLGFTVKRRTGGGKRSGSSGYSCILEFDEPVPGPIAVGYGSHFGLGLFAPVKEKS